MARDKFAAMASREASNAPNAPEQDTATAPTAAPAGGPPRRDKLAAMASRTAPSSVPAPAAAAGGRGNKLAAMASRGDTSSAPTEAPPTQENVEEQLLEKLKTRMSKRKQILENLNRAEDLTCRLIELAHQTTTALQDLSSSTDVSALSKAYRTTLQELHPLLSTGTSELIQPYQNHTNETKQSMYGARVEMRLAKERTDVLKAFTELEREENLETASTNEQTSAGKKRPREEDATAVS